MTTPTSRPPARVPPAEPWRVGVTGHSNLTAAAEVVIEQALLDALAALATRRTRQLLGVSCLAAGADRAFARAVLGLGGTLQVVLPAQDYRDRHVHAADLAEFDRLLAAARSVRTVAFDHSCRQAYMAASDAMLTAVDEVLAVWDGQPAPRYAGTADVVTEAHHRGLPVTVIWPPGATRTHLQATPASGVPTVAHR